MAEDLRSTINYLGGSIILELKKLCRAGIKNAINGIDSELCKHNIKFSLMDHYLQMFYFFNGFYDKHDLFHPSYEPWRIKRINKILELYGFDYFKNKCILEVGGGHGEIGAFFAELGAEVLCLDGRKKNAIIANLKHRNMKNFRGYNSI